MLFCPREQEATGAYLRYEGLDCDGAQHGATRQGKGRICEKSQGLCIPTRDDL